MWKEIVKKFAKLIDVKSIVTIALTILFIILAVKQIIDGNAVLTIYSTVIAFYFGTQVGKKTETNEIEEKKEE